uniref:RRM domain-containing protein n=1 Tax=Zea mays TaxID=4577 RepID=A0A804NRC0_MAIZE
MFTAAQKDFGFIGFTARQSALDCIKMVNKDGVGEGSGKVPIKASLQRPRHAFKKYSRQGSSSLLGVRRGFVDKSSSGRGHHSDRYRHFSPDRDLIPSTSQVASHCEGSCCKVVNFKRQGSDHSSRLSFEKIFKLERRLEKTVFLFEHHNYYLAMASSPTLAKRLGQHFC